MFQGFYDYLATLTVCDTCLLLSTLFFYSLNLVAVSMHYYHIGLVLLCRVMYGVR